jgi:uncharacterized protein (DUF488 family)
MEPGRAKPFTRIAPVTTIGLDMFSRQQAVLRLIANEGGKIDRLRLVKLAFLLSREVDAPKNGLYAFVPYKHGPFSFTLYHELRALERDGWITECGRGVGLTDEPADRTLALNKAFQAIVDQVSRRHRSTGTASLVDGVYRDHPWFTLNAEAPKKRAVRRPSADLAVYTIGYEGLMVDTLLDNLLRHGIKRLVDVRCNPVARRYGFHKSTLLRLCNDVGIEYLHYPDLGVPSSWRSDLTSPAAYARLFKRYEKEILPKHPTALETVATLVTEEPSALMCMEADGECCHRSRLGAEIAFRTSLPRRELSGM